MRWQKNTCYYFWKKEIENKEVSVLYEGIFSERGNYVEDDEAFEYALERCLHGNEDEKKEFKEMLVEWYYSGNWIYRKEQ